MALVLEIEHLSGVCFASLGPDGDEPDWPIQPDRVFSALIAAWATRGQDPGERAALIWLEARPMPPLIEAADAAPRTAPTVYVPPNDEKTRLGGNRDTVLGTSGRQPRRFPAVAALNRGGGLLTRLIWADVAEGEAPLAALDAVARDTAYVGHSSSLTRCRFLMGEAGTGARTARRRIHPGRFDRLEQDFAARRRPSPGEAVHGATSPERAVESAFGDDWLVLAIDEAGDGRRNVKPDLRAAPLLAKVLRDVLMTGYQKIGLAPPSLISGHAPDGAQAAGTHVAILPLADVGHAHSDAALHGLALVPPRGVKPLHDEAFREALAAVAAYDGPTRSRRLTLYGARVASANGEGAGLVLRFGGERPALRSLDPSRYTGVATTWATATPMVLERHLKAATPDGQQTEIEALVARACTHAGLPAPASVAGDEGRGGRPAVLTDKHPAILGAPPAAPSGRNPGWLRWRVPERLASRPLVHAVVRFPEPVRGPVVLGAGRFVGLGLCLPLDRRGTRR